MYELVFIHWLFQMGLVLILIGGGYAIVRGVCRAWCWWHERRELQAWQAWQADAMWRRGLKNAQQRQMIPEDLQ